MTIITFDIVGCALTHVLGEVEFKNIPGPNWKSLCEPSILPLTTDYLPV